MFREIIHGDAIFMEDASIATVGELRQWLDKEYTLTADLKACMIAVNQEYAEDDQPIGPTDEIALIPPVSGG